ncbi:MAG: hypothetical protein Q4P66_05430 [Actinomycetaceae bacterium]|nr:hypothetical protein [Actinomycetaceae bacterium]
MASLGRPRTVTIERLIEAGQAITLPALTIRGIAARLGVSEVSIYRHVECIDNLKKIVAIGIIANNDIELPSADTPEDALVELGVQLRDFVEKNPGISYYLSHLGAEEPKILEQVERIQSSFAHTYDFPLAQASIAVATLTEHAIAITSMDPFSHHQPLDRIDSSIIDDYPTVKAGSTYIRTMSSEEIFRWSIRSTARGALSIVGLV